MSLLKRILTTILFVTLIFSSFGVKAISRNCRFRIENLLRSARYDDALIEIENAERGVENDSELLMLKGVTYTYMPQYMDLADGVFDKALVHYKTQVEKNEILFFKARAMHRVERFDDALDLCDDLLAKKKKLDAESRVHVLSFRNLCIESKSLIETNRREATILPLSNINTPQDEDTFHYPLVENTIALVSKQNNTISGHTLHETSNPLVVPQFHLNDGEIVQSFSYDLNQTICIVGVKKAGSVVLYESTRVADKWTVPTQINSISSGISNDKTPYVSPDGSRLYFSSDRKGSMGGYDLYESKRTDKSSWSKPQNLGQKVNSEFDELHPWVQPATNTLYFSSNRGGAIGGYDIRSYELDANNAEVKNIGYPVNSTADDLRYMENLQGNKAYISSCRRGGKGNKDIYEVAYTETNNSTLSLYVGRTSSDYNESSKGVQIIVDGTHYSVVEPMVDGRFYALVPNNSSVAHEEIIDENESIVEEPLVESKPVETMVEKEVISNEKQELVKSTHTSISGDVYRTYHLFFEQKYARLTEYSKMVLKNIAKNASSLENSTIVVSEISGVDYFEGNESTLVTERVQSIETFFDQNGVEYKLASIQKEEPFVVDSYFARNCPYLQLGATLNKGVIDKLGTKEYKQKAMLLNRRVKIEIRIE